MIPLAEVWLGISTAFASGEVSFICAVARAVLHLIDTPVSGNVALPSSSTQLIMVMRKYLFLLSMLGFSTCAVDSALALGLSFDWGPTKECFDTKSPPMRVSGVPAGTTKLRFKMIDLNAPDYPHGGGTVAYSGNGSFPYGAFRYTGPCPPSPHVYQFTVEALDGSGKTLAKATAKKRFP